MCPFIFAIFVELPEWEPEILGLCWKPRWIRWEGRKPVWLWCFGEMEERWRSRSCRGGKVEKRGGGRREVEKRGGRRREALFWSSSQPRQVQCKQSLRKQTHCNDVKITVRRSPKIAWEQTNHLNSYHNLNNKVQTYLLKRGVEMTFLWDFIWYDNNSDHV